MATLDELKNKWRDAQQDAGILKTYDQATLQNIYKMRTKKQLQVAMNYFWAAFVMQLIVYALLTNTIIRYWHDPEVFYLGAAGIILFAPFTYMLLNKYKAMAAANVRKATNDKSSMFAFIQKQHDLLSGFYSFKKWYEWLLIPLATAIGVFLVFKLYVPGGVWQYPMGAFITFALTIGSCVAAIRAENKRNFEDPLKGFRELLKEFE